MKSDTNPNVLKSATSPIIDGPPDDDAFDAVLIDQVPEPGITHYVSLDLGSDSMASYSEPLVPTRRSMVSLQEYRPRLAASADGAAVPRGDSNQQSSLMRTLILFREPLRPTNLKGEELEEAHARLEFTDANGNCDPRKAEESIFVFFPTRFEKGKVMPNPKLVYQSGCRMAIPNLEVKDNGRVQFDPGTLLKHLTAQVLNNFVLHSPEPRGVDKKNVHVALTVPNVYSMTHARELQTFVKRIVGAGEVSIVSESDALVYYLLSRTASPAVQKFRKTVVQPKRRPELRIVTLDIGRGTTDLSLVQIRREGSRIRTTHFTAARTGVCSAGQGLSYIIAKYYSGRLRKSFEEAGLKEPLFDFIHFTDQHKEPQRLANEALQDLIEKIKENLDEQYRVSLAGQDELVDAIFEKVKAARQDANPTPEDDERLKKALHAHFALPNDLRNPSGNPPSLLARWSRALTGKNSPDPAFPHISMLVAEIEEYVKRNVDDMIEQLETIAREFQRVQLQEADEKMRNVFEPDVTFVLVGGQASQFKPIVRAIREAFQGKIPVEQIHFLRHAEAKTACAKGAVTFLKTRPRLQNEGSFFGTYGFLAAADTGAGSSFVPVNSVELMRTGRDIVKGVDEQDQYFIYVVRPVGNETDKDDDDQYTPALLDGYTSMIDALGKREDANILVEYDAERLYLKLNGKPVVAVSGHGYVDEAIQPKLWPVIVDTEDEDVDSSAAA